MKLLKVLLVPLALVLSSQFIAQDYISRGRSKLAVATVLPHWKCRPSYSYGSGIEFNVQCTSTCGGVCFKRTGSSVVVTSCVYALPADSCDAFFKEFQWNVQTTGCINVGSGCGCDTTWSPGSSQIITLPVCEI